MTITEAIKQAGYASNDFQAAHIANGLRLYELPTEAEQLARVALYRKWRAKTDKKNDIPAWQAFQLAIAGIDPSDIVARQIELKISQCPNGGEHDIGYAFKNEADDSIDSPICKKCGNWL